MTDFTSVAIPPPKDWQAFERNARLLFEYALNDPAVQNNGRPGQRQHGVDVFGRRGGGTGQLAGVQCKGKDSGYGKAVTEKELAAEVEKARKFTPRLDEFKLITTAPDDQKIQEAARVLEVKIRADGWPLSIEVWGWGRIQEEINRYPEVLRRFHPDATPFTGEILDEIKETRRLVATEAEASRASAVGIEQRMLRLLDERLPRIASDPPSSADALNQELNKQIDGYRELLRNNQPRTAIGLLKSLLDRLGPNADVKIRYRVISNIGAAHYNLGEFDVASDFLLEAAPFNPNDPVSLANKTAALLIKDRKEEARTVALEALATHADSEEIALQRLQALGPGETVETVWQSLSEKAKNSAMAFAIRVASLREARDARWIELANEGAAAYPNDETLKIIKAESVVERLVNVDPGGIGLEGANVPTQAELTQAAETMEKAWKDSLGKETPVKAASAHNAALAWSLIGNTRHAGELLDAAMAQGFNDSETKNNRIMLFRRNGQVAEAIKLADTLDDAPISRIIRADLRIDTEPRVARDLLSNRASFTRPTDIIAAALAVIETLIKEDKFAEAEAEAERLEKALPSHPQGALSLFRLKSARGDEDTASVLDRALALITEETDFPTRFLVAEALASVQRFDDVADLLSGRTSAKFDSPALRALVAAAINTDRRVMARNIFKELPDALASKSFYQKAKVALEVRSGNIRAAEEGIRSFLTRDPSNLELHLQLLHSLFRQDKLDQLREEVAKPAAGFKGAPEDLMKLAQFKDDFGDWREAHALGYNTLLANPTNQTVSMGYVGIFLRPGHSREMAVSPPVVENDMAVALALEDGATSTFVIESKSNLRPSAQYISPEHRVAKSLLGKNVGDTIELPDKTRATIRWIKTKELHALHDILDNFNNRYPDARGLERVRIDPTKVGGLEPVLEKVRDRHDAIEEVNKLYEAGTMPLALVARSVGSDPVEALVGLANLGLAIRSCEGTHLERAAAMAAINANGAKGCVVDSVTLHIIRRLKLETAVTAICGPIGIVEETALRLQQRIHELGERPDEIDTSILYRDGQYFRQETMPEQKKQALALAEEDRKWLAENTTIIPAEGKQDPSASWRPLIERFGSSFLDDVRAAQGSGRLLVCEDQLLRTLAQLDFSVPGTWLQPVLMRGHAKKVITEAEYRDAIVHLIETGIEFISISPELLVSAVSGTTGHVVPGSFDKLVSRLGGKKADMQSHFSVAVGAAVRIWNDKSLSHTIRQAALGRLLERLIIDRPISDVRMIVSSFLQRAPQNAFAEYIIDWLRGHFIDVR
jgi:tetratricopeptide (TPR) repeat protein